MDHIHDIWIMQNTGIVLFNYGEKNSVDPQLFGGLMSAINTFAESLSKGGLQSFEVRERRYTITNRQSLTFVVSSNKAVKKKQVHKELEKISDTFITKYAKQIKHFDGAVDQFSGFEEELLKDSVSSLGKLKKAFW